MRQRQNDMNSQYIYLLNYCVYLYHHMAFSFHWFIEIKRKKEQAKVKYKSWCNPFRFCIYMRLGHGKLSIFFLKCVNQHKRPVENIRLFLIFHNLQDFCTSNQLHFFLKSFHVLNAKSFTSQILTFFALQKRTWITAYLFSRCQ